MLANLRKLFKNSPLRTKESKSNQSSLLLTAFIGLLEDALFWKTMWLSLVFITIINLIFFICFYRQINILGFTISLVATFLIMDAFESWLKHKHRTSCLKRLAHYDGKKILLLISYVNTWVKKKWIEYSCLRETNHTKAFLINNIILISIFIIGKYFSGYSVAYILIMMVCFMKKLAPPIIKFWGKLQLSSDSDAELEGLIPDISDIDIKLLSVEPEVQPVEDKHSLDYWKPEDVPTDDVSDSSESSSIVTNLSIEKSKAIDKDIETSDTSDEEYIPLVQQDILQSTIEVIQPSNTWSNTAYNALWSLTGVMTNIVKSTQDDSQRRRIPSRDSSDGFEIIDKNEI